MRDFLIGVFVLNVIVLGGGYFLVMKPSLAADAAESLSVLEEIRTFDEDTELPATPGAFTAEEL